MPNNRLNLRCVKAIGLGLLFLFQCLGSIAPAHAAANVEIVPPRGATFGFAIPLVVVVKSLPFTLIQADTEAGHNMVSVVADDQGDYQTLYGPDTSPWCGEFNPGTCPLFWSGHPVRGPAALQVDLANLTVGATYTFACEVHPYMLGDIRVVG